MRRNRSAQVALPDATISGSGIRSPIPWPLLARNEVDLGILVQIIVVRTQLVATAYAPLFSMSYPHFASCRLTPTQLHQRLPRNRINRDKTLPASPFVTIVTSFPLTGCTRDTHSFNSTRLSKETKRRRRFDRRRFERFLLDRERKIEIEKERSNRSFCQEEYFSRNDQQCRPLILLFSSRNIGSPLGENARN